MWGGGSAIRAPSARAVATLALRLCNDKGHRRVTLERRVGGRGGGNETRAIVEFQMNARLNEPLESHHVFNSAYLPASNEIPRYS